MFARLTEVGPMVETAQSNVARSRRVNGSLSQTQPAEALSQYNTGDDLRDFPIASRRERKLLVIPDPILEFYAFLFCQGRYLSLGMTFEQFLIVVTSVRLDHGFAT
jgi:hypothetical protein